MGVVQSIIFLAIHIKNYDGYRIDWCILDDLKAKNLTD